MNHDFGNQWHECCGCCNCSCNCNCNDNCNSCGCGNDIGEQEAMQLSSEFQSIDELVVVKDSCDVTICVTDKQLAFSLQAALQAAIIVVLQVCTGDREQGIIIAQELFVASKIKQINKQKFIVSHSKNVYIESTDMQATINIQILVQLLLALVEKVNTTPCTCSCTCNCGR